MRAIMERQDIELPYIQRYENIAWYEDGIVRILDRRIYPAKIEFVICKKYEDVMLAIRNMVTQSAGPYTAAPMGMALAAWECRDMSEHKQLEFLIEAAEVISNARPTTKERIKIVLDGCFPTIRKALMEGRRVDLAIRNHVIEANNRRYEKIGVMGEYLADLFPNGGSVMTQCYADTILGTMLRACKKKNKIIKLFVPETRPYLQGARLTATVCAEMGFDTTLITDVI